MNSPGMGLLRRKGGNIIDRNGTGSGCDFCTFGKRQEEAHPRNTTHKAGGPIEFVKADLVVPLQPDEDLGMVPIELLTDKAA